MLVPKGGVIFRAAAPARNTAFDACANAPAAPGRACSAIRTPHDTAMARTIRVCRHTDLSGIEKGWEFMMSNKSRFSDQHHAPTSRRSSRFVKNTTGSRAAEGEFGCHLRLPFADGTRKAATEICDAVKMYLLPQAKRAAPLPPEALILSAVRSGCLRLKVLRLGKSVLRLPPRKLPPPAIPSWARCSECGRVTRVIRIRPTPTRERGTANCQSNASGGNNKPMHHGADLSF